MSGFLRYAINRLLTAIPILIGVLIIVFISVRLIPGDPARLLAGPDATADDVNRLREVYGLNRPLVYQFISYLGELFKGNLGTSIRTNLPIQEIIGDYYINTLKLATLSILMAVFVSVPIGIFSAVKRGALTERLTFLISMFGITAPTFWIALLFQLIFAVQLGIFHTGGAESISDLVLPALTIAAYPIASLTRQTRAAMLEVLSEDYIQTAFAKGIKTRRIFFRHALTNALIPIVTLAGYQFALALGGAIVAETVFSYPGVGRYLILSISTRDYPAIQSTILIIAATYVLISLLTDLSYHFIDPRITYE